MTPTLTPIEYCEQQAEKRDRAAGRQAEWMRAFELPTPAEYEPPRSDDPTEWTGLLAYVYHDWLYREHCRSAYALRSMGKPLACPLCGEGEGRGREVTRRLCLDHGWSEWGYEWVLQSARSLARRGSYPGPVSEAGVDRSAWRKRGAA